MDGILCVCVTQVEPTIDGHFKEKKKKIEIGEMIRTNRQPNQTIIMIIMVSPLSGSLANSKFLYQNVL